MDKARAQNSEQSSFKLVIKEDTTAEGIQSGINSASIQMQESLQIAMLSRTENLTPPFTVEIDSFVRIRRAPEQFVLDWRKFEHFGRINQLRHKGRGLLGNEIEWLEKRDGQNIPFYWSDADSTVHFGSRNNPIPDSNINNAVMKSTGYKEVFKLVREHPQFIIYVEQMPIGRGPCKIEMRRKYGKLILFGMWDKSQNCYVRYNLMHQYAHHYKIPIVRIVDRSKPATLEELHETKFDMFIWCKKHHREGVVGRCLTKEGMVLFKEKIDLPKKSKTLEREHVRPEYPRMPQNTAMRAIAVALQRTIDDGHTPNSPREAMPYVAEELKIQATEHCYHVPTDMFELYNDFVTKHAVIQISEHFNEKDIWTLEGIDIYYKNN